MTTLACLIVFDVLRRIMKNRTSLSICERLATEGLASAIELKSELSVGASEPMQKLRIWQFVGGITIRH